MEERGAKICMHSSRCDDEVKKKVIAAMMIKSFLRVVVHVSTISFLSLSLCVCLCVRVFVCLIIS
jgi:hypothetical protein